MIATLTGRLKRKATDYLIVDVSGVGYQVQVPLSTFDNLADDGEEVSLLIHTHLREDSLSLFGFLTQAEKDLFLLLLGVSGIGPRLAMGILSSQSVQDLSHAIQDSDESKLSTIPGIGKKTAARMVLELKDKIKLLAPSRAPEPAAIDAGDVEDAVSALINLGYKKYLAEEALKKVRQGRPVIAIEELIREALNVLMKR
jgi:Holliday junction DNA helicase RuvA